MPNDLPESIARPKVQIVTSSAAAPIAELLGRRGWEVGPVRPFSAPPTCPATVIVLHPDRQDRDRAIQLCLLLRASSPRSPAILVLQPGESTDCAIQMFEAGADDCLAAPHNPREVVARVQALHRRMNRTRPRVEVNLGGASGTRFNQSSRTLIVPGRAAVELTERQARLLSALVKRAGSWVDRDTLLDEVLGPEADAFERAIDVHVCRLKRKLVEAEVGDLILSSRGAGYRVDLTAGAHPH
jgi:DNA-binding response OmpR family regulator